MSEPDTSQEIRAFVPQFWRLMKPFRKLAFKAMIWIVVMQVLALAEPWLVMYVIDGLAGHEPTRAARWLTTALVAVGILGSEQSFSHHLLPVILIMFGVLGGIGVAQVFKNRRIRDVWFAIEHELPLTCGRKLLSLPLPYHQRENTGAIVGKVVRGVGKCTDVVGVLLWEIIPLAVQSVVTVALLLWFSVPAALVLLPIVMVFGWLTARIKLRLSGKRIRRHELYGESDEVIGQAVTNVMTTQAFAQEERELATVSAIRTQARVMAEGEFRSYDGTDMVRNLLVSAGRVGVIYVAARAALGAEISMGMLVFVSTLAEKVFVSCYRIGAVFDRLMEAAEPVMRMTQIFAEPETVADPASPAKTPARFRGDIAFDELSFTYGEQAAPPRKPALADVSLQIAAGETVAIVGESGGGKSTLVKMLLRFGDPNVGRVTIDGADVRSFRKTDFRRQIGYVPQEVEIYDMTVADNIAYGRPDATRDDIVAAAKVAHAHDFILSLPNGYDELVGNRGLRLSGGQRQRVGIARAVLLDPPILVFDEATSHVDVVSEAKIHAAMETLRHGKTVIIIAHRLSTVQNADRIVVLDQGRIKEVGSHRELLEKRGIYHGLVGLQARVEASM